LNSECATSKGKCDATRNESIALRILNNLSANFYVFC